MDPSPHPFGCSIIIILRRDLPAMDAQPKKLVCVIIFFFFFVFFLLFFLLLCCYCVYAFPASSSIYSFQLVTACIVVDTFPLGVYLGDYNSLSPEDFQALSLGTSPRNRFLCREPPDGCEKVETLKIVEHPVKYRADRFFCFLFSIDRAVSIMITFCHPFF